MRYALCPLSVVPVRSGPAHKSEQITQMLFGEAVEILERKGNLWAKVRCLWDDTVGWVDGRQLKPVSDREFRLANEFYAVNLDLIHPIATGEGFMPIPMGSRLPQFDGIQLHINGETYTFSGQAVDPEALPARTDLLIKLARKYLWAPQQKGGRSPLGIDSAGLIQNIFLILGISLPRDCEDQVLAGDAVDFAEQAQPGDLAFFENRKGTVHHVGLILPQKEILHVAGQVRIDLLDHYGIFDRERKQYSHRLRVIRRLPLENDAPVSGTGIAREETMVEAPQPAHPELFSVGSIK